VADARRSCKFPDELGFGAVNASLRPRPQTTTRRAQHIRWVGLRDEMLHDFERTVSLPTSSIMTMASLRGAAAASGWFMQVRHSLRPSTSTLHNAPGRTHRYCDLAR